jgi:glycerol-3-phosphate acyltransferase PlsY
VQKCWWRFRVSANCAKMLVVPNMKVLTNWRKLSSSSALGHYLPIFTDFEGDKSIHG